MSTQPAVEATKPEASGLWAPVIKIALMVTVIVSVILTVFAWPVVSATPKNLQVGITSTVAGLADGIQEEFDRQRPGVFNFVDYPDLAAAKKAVQKREVYGALVLTETPTMLIASGASPVVAQLLTNLSIELGSQITASYGIEDINFVVEDLAPLGTKDPRGAGLAAGSLPLIIAGIVVGLLGSMRLKRTRQKLAVSAIAGVTVGLAMVSILNLWLGSLQGNFFVEVLVVGLGVAAVATTVMGASALFGRGGLLGVVGLFFIIGNPLSAVGVPTEFYPGSLGLFGQYLPLGAELQLLRSVSYFPEASTVNQWLTLGAWLIVGILLLALARKIKPRVA